MPAVEIVDFHSLRFWEPPKEGFTHKLEAVGLKEINGKKEVFLNFGTEEKDGEEIPRELVYFGLNFIKTESKDGKNLSDSFSLGKLRAAASRFGYRLFVDQDANKAWICLDAKNMDGTSLVGKDLKMKLVREKVDGDKVYRDFVIDEIIGIGKPGATPPAKETAPASKIDATSMTEKWKEFLAENLTSPTNEAGIIKLVNSKIPDATARKPYSETRKAALTALVTEGFLNNDEGKYSVA